MILTASSTIFLLNSLQNVVKYKIYTNRKNLTIEVFIFYIPITYKMKTRIYYVLISKNISIYLFLPLAVY